MMNHVMMVDNILIVIIPIVNYKPKAAGIGRSGVLIPPLLATRTVEQSNMTLLQINSKGKNLMDNGIWVYLRHARCRSSNTITHFWKDTLVEVPTGDADVQNT